VRVYPVSHDPSVASRGIKTQRQKS
jgi:hypothetical protein